jgi:hypothetical protein
VRFLVATTAKRLATELRIDDESGIARILAEMLAQPCKPDVFDALVPGGVLVILDARRPGVVVPKIHSASPKLGLRFGLDLVPPIVDLSYDANGVSGVLSFGGVSERCVVPWSAVYAMTSVIAAERGAVWTRDVPPDVETSRSAAAAPDRRGLKLVD